MFDPFGDYETAGYLHNIERIKDLDELKYQEHGFFEANLEKAMTFLRSVRGDIAYEHFLEVHGILFDEFYPWAGKDRYSLGVARLVGKGQRIQFEASEQCQRAVEWGLDIGNHPLKMREAPGTVMGAFAWAHPFLDGNGRTMLLVHAELCYRANFAINWSASRKEAYLEALTKEIESPADKHLDSYFAPLIVDAVSHAGLLAHLTALPGLDGQTESSGEDVAYMANDPVANRLYLEMKRARRER
ncbi:Fic family protein [Caballeronia sp. GAWG1-1]|uniref:Fic family protein n=1 Tax=Caballeronia sp. GAWG1-1 TaxID=2921742 RepID=UPI00202973B2